MVRVRCMQLHLPDGANGTGLDWIRYEVGYRGVLILGCLIPNPLFNDYYYYCYCYYYSRPLSGCDVFASLGCSRAPQ